jgi:hypothetical protein
MMSSLAIGFGVACAAGLIFLLGSALTQACRKLVDVEERLAKSADANTALRAYRAYADAEIRELIHQRDQLLVERKAYAEEAERRRVAN